VYYAREPGKVLCQVAAEDKCVMLVVGARQPTTGLFQSSADQKGSIVEYVLRKSPCPVVIARQPDPSKASESVPLTWAAGAQYNETLEPEGRARTNSFNAVKKSSSFTKIRTRKSSCPDKKYTAPPSYEELKQAGKAAVGGGEGWGGGGGGDHWVEFVEVAEDTPAPQAEQRRRRCNSYVEKF